MQAAAEVQTLITQLADRICGFAIENIPDEAIHLSKQAIIDTIGVTLAGMSEPAVTKLLLVPGVAQAPGRSTIFGSTVGTSALDAALVNGTSSHALDYDDFSQSMGGHQSVPLVAPLFALAEERQASGRSLIHAYIVGIETEIKIAKAVNFVHYDKGWHPTATLGVFGAAAACGYLIGLDRQRMAMALAIASSMAAGIKANFGTMTKPLHIGNCGRSGLFAALLAEQDYSAHAGALEHKQGFLNVYNGTGLFDAQRMLDAWASPLEVLGMDMGLKQFPCCGSTHPALMLLLQLLGEHDVSADSVQEVLVFLHRRRLPHTNNPDPATPLAAKFSVQYVVARALMSGGVRLSDFMGETYRDPAVRQIMSRIKVRPNPEMDDDAPGQFGAKIKLTLNNGATIEGELESIVGRGRTNPMSRTEMLCKFQDCAERIISKSNAEKAFDLLDSLEQIEDINHLTHIFAQRQLLATTSN
ncbi:MmgE/PrpD family protein [Alcaligenaceae bacterium CGII-47]|nr:MmgE/PrpD family protein [Alcaligenaceae bacterium CGII-47]